MKVIIVSVHRASRSVGRDVRPARGYTCTWCRLRTFICSRRQCGEPRYPHSELRNGEGGRRAWYATATVRFASPTDEHDDNGSRRCPSIGKRQEQDQGVGSRCGEVVATLHLQGDKMDTGGHRDPELWSGSRNRGPGKHCCAPTQWDEDKRTERHATRTPSFTTGWNVDKARKACGLMLASGDDWMTRVRTWQGHRTQVFLPRGGFCLTRLGTMTVLSRSGYPYHTRIKPDLGKI